MIKKFLAVATAAIMVSSGIVMAHTVAKKGMKADLVLMPKFLGILVFDQANQGAQEAHTKNCKTLVNWNFWDPHQKTV